MIDQPSDAWVISDNTFTLRQGETVVTRITRRGLGERSDAQAMLSDAPAASPSAGAAVAGPTYEGKNLDEWLAHFERERSPAELATAFKAIQALANRESGPKVSQVFLRVLPQLPADLRLSTPQGMIYLDASAFELIKKLLEPRLMMETIINELATGSPEWQQRLLVQLEDLIDLSQYPDTLEPLVEQVNELAENQEHRVVSWVALRKLLTLAGHQHQRGKSVERAVESLITGVEALSESEQLQFFSNVVLDISWPEPLQQFLMQRSIEQLVADDALEWERRHAIINISVNIPLALRLQPDLPQIIAAKLMHYAAAFDGNDYQVLAPTFVKPAVTMLAAAFRLPHPKLPEAKYEVPANHRRDLHVSTILLLAALAVHPDLRSDQSDQELRTIADRLAPEYKRTRIEEMFRPPASKFWEILFSPRSPTEGVKLLPLYRISSGVVEQDQPE